MSDFDLGNFLINGDEDNKLHEYQTKVIEGLLANPPDQNDITIVEYVFPISKSLCGKYRGNSIFLLDDSNNAKSILENDNWRNFFIKVLFIFYIKKIDYAIFGNEEWIVRTCLHYFSTITTYPLIQYLIKCIYLTNNFYIDNNKIGYENTIEIKTIIFNHISLSYMDYSKNKDIIDELILLLPKLSTKLYKYNSILHKNICKQCDKDINETKYNEYLNRIDPLYININETVRVQLDIEMACACGSLNYLNIYNYNGNNENIITGEINCTDIGFVVDFLDKLDLDEYTTLTEYIDTKDLGDYKYASYCIIPNLQEYITCNKYFYINIDDYPSIIKYLIKVIFMYTFALLLKKIIIFLTIRII